jgi:hypothetical protein
MSRIPVAVVLLLLACTAPATAQIFKDPTFEASVLEPTLTPGAEQTVTVSLTNDAIDEDHVAKTARTLEVRVGPGSAPLTVRSGPRFVDRLPDEERRTFDVVLSVPADAPAGEYRLPVRIDYEFDNERETAQVFATVRIEARPRFEVVSTSADLSVGDRGTVTVTVENVGSEVASQSRLTLTSRDRTLSFGDAAAASRSLGVVEPGEQRTVSFVASTTDAARPQQYAATAALTYERPDGEVVSADVGTVSVRPTPELRFAFRDVGGRLRLGERGVVTGTVVNRGPDPVWSVVAVLQTPSNTVQVLEPVAPVGRLAPGDARTVSFPVRAASGGTDGPQSFVLELRYETRDGRTLTADDVRFRRSIGPEQEPFRLEPVNASVGVDESARLTVRLTNVGDVPFRDVDAQFTPRLPFTSEAPESYAGTLAPGESATLAFEVTVSEDAVTNTHALAVNVTAERPDGRTVQHGPYYVPVTVTEQPGATSDVETLVAAAVLVLVVLVAGWWWLRA